MALVGVALFAGEYSTVDWLTLHHQLADEEQQVRELRVELDSLGRMARALETDPGTQERVAREGFGLIRNGEIVYKIVPEK